CSRSIDARHAAIEVRSDARTGAVAPLQLRQIEPAGRNQRVDRSIQMTSPGDPAPRGRQAVLPADNARLRRASVLDEDQPAVPAQHSPDLAERSPRIGDGAE